MSPDSVKLPSLHRATAALLSRRGMGARLSILIYHRVLPTPDPLRPSIVDTAAFDVQMATLKKVFKVLKLSEAVERLYAGTLPARAACITFDDGYTDNFTHALPVLKRHGLPATFFIATAYLNGGRMFNDTVTEAVRRTGMDAADFGHLGLGSYNFSSSELRLAAIRDILQRVKYLSPETRESTVEHLARDLTDEPLPCDLMMTTSQLSQLRAAGMEIGAHTHHHPILSSTPRDRARHEISHGKALLENILDTRMELFAYPNGRPGTDYRREHVELVKDLGFKAAFSTAWGSAHTGLDRFQLPRYSPWARSAPRFSHMLMRNLIRQNTLPALV